MNFGIKNEELCIENEQVVAFYRESCGYCALLRPQWDEVSKNDEICIKNEEICIINAELCI